jgi:chromosomal replication initiator protein
MRVVRDEPSRLILGLPDSFGVDWVTNHYKDVLQTELQRLAPGVDLELTVAPSPTPVVIPEMASGSIDAAPREHTFSQISDRYTFANFVTGPSNQLAAAAAHTVAENPGRAYNPLFVFGRVGLGKTHLIQAVDHQVLQETPDAIVQYHTTEQFVNDVVHGIQTKRMAEIRAVYRACDVLLIDDIQFIAGKEASQDEFFHTFNTLHAAEKQVIVTSDKLPHEIKDLEDRIRSRFQWGLIVDLQPPELETRVAIVRKKAITDGIALSDEVAMFIAQSVRSNVRELEGCLIRVSAYASLRNEPLTVELARDVLRDILPGKNVLTCDTILKATAQHFEVKIQDLKSSKRARAISLPRQVAMYLCRKHTQASYPEIGRALGGRDHTTAINAFRRISDRSDDPDLRRHIESIEQTLTS